MPTDHREPLGFIGLGTMGTPMALNLVRSGTPLLVWNRTAAKSRRLEEAGAEVAPDAADLIGRVRVVILMVSTSEAVDAVLGRDAPDFVDRLAGRLVVNMGTCAPAYSLALDRDMRAAGARYVEAPVSGQREPAEAGRLIAMLAGEQDDVDEVGPLLAPMCRGVIQCGPVPQALSIKIASNAFVGPMIACLAESVALARGFGVDMQVFSKLMTNSPMASDLMRMKLPKLIDHDFTVQASLDVFLGTADLIQEAASATGLSVPMVNSTKNLCLEAKTIGGPEQDVTAVIRVLERRS